MYLKQVGDAGLMIEIKDCSPEDDAATELEKIAEENLLSVIRATVDGRINANSLAAVNKLDVDKTVGEIISNMKKDVNIDG